jgi:hypothetical protein
MFAPLAHRKKRTPWMRLLAGTPSRCLGEMLVISRRRAEMQLAPTNGIMVLKKRA